MIAAAPDRSSRIQHDLEAGREPEMLPDDLQWFAAADPKQFRASQKQGAITRGRMALETAITGLAEPECETPAQASRDERADARRARGAVVRRLNESLADLAELAAAHPLEWGQFTITLAAVEGMTEPCRRLERAVKAAMMRPQVVEYREDTTAEWPLAGVELQRLTDLGNARRWVQRYGRDYHWCADSSHGGWIAWTGSRWQPDRKNRAHHDAKAMSDLVRAEAARAAREAQEKEGGEAGAMAYKEWMQWAQASEAGPRIRSVLDIAHSDPLVSIDIDAFDQDPMLFNTPGETLQLYPGEVRPHRREDLLMHQGGVAFDPNARADRWAEFVLEIMGGDVEMAAYLQRIAGYCMTGVLREPAFFIFHGNGRNGKGTFVERIRKVLGTYAANTPTSTFLAKNDGGIPNDVAALKGRRMVTMSETESGAKLEEALVKQVTGKDPVSARFMRGEFFDFIPLFKAILQTNHQPTVKNMDDGIWSRIFLVPFNVSFKGREDTTLDAKLDVELPGILNWMLDGVIEWKEKGLSPPERAVKAVAKYKEDMDVIARFLEDCTIRSSMDSTTNPEMFAAWKEWCQENNEREGSQRNFTQRMEARGDLVHSKASGRPWEGIKLLKRAGQARSW